MPPPSTGSGERIGQGRENVKRFLIENQDIYERIYQKTREALGFVKKEVEEVVEEAK